MTDLVELTVMIKDMTSNGVERKKISVNKDVTFNNLIDHFKSNHISLENASYTTTVGTKTFDIFGSANLHEKVDTNKPMVLFKNHKEGKLGFGEGENGGVTPSPSSSWEDSLTDEERELLKPTDMSQFDIPTAEEMLKKVTQKLESPEEIASTEFEKVRKANAANSRKRKETKAKTKKNNKAKAKRRKEIKLAKAAYKTTVKKRTEEETARLKEQQRAAKRLALDNSYNVDENQINFITTESSEMKKRLSELSANQNRLLRMLQDIHSTQELILAKLDESQTRKMQAFDKFLNIAKNIK